LNFGLEVHQTAAALDGDALAEAFALGPGASLAFSDPFLKGEERAKVAQLA